MMNTIHQQQVRKHTTQHFKYMQGPFRYTTVVFYGNTLIIYEYNSAYQVYDNQVNQKYCINLHALCFLPPIAILQLGYKLYPSCFLECGHDSTFFLVIVLNRCCTLNSKLTNFKLLKPQTINS